MKTSCRCAFDEKYTVIFGSGAGENTRFAWNAKNPQLARYFSGHYPAYLHCQLRICFEEDNYTGNKTDEIDGILCPEMCDHGKPDPKWNDEIGYQPLTIHTVGGPYFLSNTDAVDLTRIREIEEYLEPNSDIQIENQRRFMKMFATDDEIHNRENPQKMLPIWVPILVSVLTGFAMGIGKSRNKFQDCFLLLKIRYFHPSY